MIRIQRQMRHDDIMSYCVLTFFISRAFVYNVIIRKMLSE